MLPHRLSHLRVAAHLCAQSVELWERLPDRKAIDLRVGLYSQHDADSRVSTCDELALTDAVRVKSRVQLRSVWQSN